MTPTLAEADFSLPGLIRQLDSPAGVLIAAVAGYAEARIAHNTSAYASKPHPDAPLTIGVVLHRTTIARFHRILATDGTPDLWLLTINTGGWDTVTTRDRLNRVLRPLGLSIYRDRGTTRIGGCIQDGRLFARDLASHDGHRLPVATVLTDGTRIVPPALPDHNLTELARRTSGRLPLASLTAAAPSQEVPA